MRTIFRILTEGLLLTGLCAALAQQTPNPPAPSPTVPPANPPAATVTPAPAATDLAPAIAAPLEPAKPAPAPPAKPKPKKAAGVSFHGTLSAVDKAAMTITVATKTKDRVFHVTSKTRFTRDGKPAILDDGVIGEEVAGYAKPAKHGKSDLTSVRFGAKPTAGKKPATGSKAKKNKATGSTAH